MTGGRQSVEIGIAADRLRFNFGGGAPLDNCLIAGLRPDKSRVMLRNEGSHMRLPRTPLLEVLQQLRVAIARAGTFHLRWTMTPGLLTMSSGKAAAPARKEQIERKAAVQPMEITFDMAFLQDMLVALDSEALEGSLVDSAAPTVFRIAGSDGFTGLPMPVRS